MKKIIIGRSPDCHIRIKDDSDKISRRQAVIEVSPFGKMIIHDTSSNGTFVNGKPVEKPNGTPVTRADVVDLAHVMNLDWSLVRDPYRGMKIAVGIFCLVLVALGVFYFIYADTLFERSDKNLPEKTIVVDSLDEDSRVADETTDSIAAPAAKSSAKKAAAPKQKKNPKNTDSVKEDPRKKVPNLPDVRPKQDGNPNGIDNEGIKPKDLTPSRGNRSMKEEKNK
ncbi:MAG: FHA domain-containing protein [Muribaculaceae bacterium]|nr:FHA domain-containing protein [Muribaculaceae bacterium]